MNAVPTTFGPAGSPEEIACPLQPTCNNFDGRGCATCLQQAVEKAQREEGQAKLELAQHQRQQFWIDTCREVSSMQKASPQVLALHRQHGCCFGAPSPQQVQCILEALDSARPGWGADHPELFYMALELNFPELRVRRA